MKRKLKAVCVATLVLALQLFSVFLPGITAAAAEADAVVETTVEVSLSKTKIVDDLKKDSLGNPVDLAELYPLDQTYGTEDARIIATHAQANGDSYDFYIYVYVPAGAGSAISGKFTLNLGIKQYSFGGQTLFEAPNKTVSKTAKVIDATETIVKYRVGLSASEYAAARVTEIDPSSGLYTSVNRVELKVFEITYDTYALTGSIGYTSVIYNAISESIEGGNSRSSLVFNLGNNGQFVSGTKLETLELDVHLSASRYSTSDPSMYDQINTAMFLIPTRYLEQWKQIAQIHYQYAIFDRVPMLVTECDRSDLMTGDRWFYLYGEEDGGVVDGVFGKQMSLMGSPITASFGRWPTDKNAKELFLFYVDQIAGDKKDIPELTDAECISRYLSLKELYGLTPSNNKLMGEVAAVIGAGSYSATKEYTKTLDDWYETVSFEDSLNGLSKWLLNVFGYSVEDDSVNVKAIQTASIEDLAKTDDELKQMYALGDVGVGQLRELLTETVGFGESQTVVVFHYLKTNYYVENAEYWLKDQKLGLQLWNDFSDDTYYCEDAIIDDFKILQIDFGETELSCLPISMQTMTFIQAPESPDKLDPTVFDGGLWKGFGGAVEALWQTVRMILVVLVVVILVIVALKGIATLRDAFGRRR